MFRRLLVSGFIALILGLQLAWSLDWTGRHTDLASFRSAGRAAVAGENPYAITPEVWYVDLPHLGIRAATVNLNAPLSLIFLEALAPLDLPALFRASILLQLLLYALVIVVLARAYPGTTTARRLAWAICLTGFWQILALGQIYLWLVLITIAVWLMLRAGRLVIAGLLIGILVAIKPNFVIWPILLAGAGAWPVALAAAGSAVGLSMIPLLRYGPVVYQQWLAATSLAEALLPIPGNSSLPGFFARLGVPAFGVILAAVSLCALAVWTWRRRPDLHTTSALALVAMLLTGPVSWSGYTLLLLPALWERPWTPALRLGAGMLALPFVLVWTLSESSWAGFVIGGAWWTWALLVIGVAFWRAASVPRLPYMEPDVGRREVGDGIVHRPFHEDAMPHR